MHKDYISFDEIKKRGFKNENTKKEYDALKPEFELISRMITERTQKKLSQSELAKKIGTKQSAISRFESGSYHPTMSFLYKVAAALGVNLKVMLEKKE